ncbi:MAG: TRIC cation channel family protein, partial [Rhodospirillales bacterium]|nr:TRIC cation channel family protein [Rhodospirillales bacterium]
RDLDIFGVVVLAFLTAVAGGITRDVLIGAVPPDAIASWEPLAIAVAAGLLASAADTWLLAFRFPAVIFDALGLGVFAVTGAAKALDHGLPALMAAVLGMVSGIGGGVARDVLTMRIPTVLTSEIYAVAALAGAGVAIGGLRAGVPQSSALVAGIVLCVGLRLLAVYRGLNLPRAGARRATPPPRDGEPDRRQRDRR